LQSVVSWIEKHSPYLVLLLFLFIWNHKQGLLTFVWLTVLINHGSQAIKQQGIQQYQLQYFVYF